VAEVKAELVGNLWKIVVEVGQAVEEDDTLMILESMKMEIPITTPISGTVTQILVTEGQVVQEGQTVAVVEWRGGRVTVSRRWQHSLARVRP
jgi:biotin carboxyl carrier protein